MSSTGQNVCHIGAGGNAAAIGTNGVNRHSAKSWKHGGCDRKPICRGESVKMSYWKRLLLITVAIVLFGCGLWANVANAPLSETRGLWITQAMRGTAY
jgi:hypothetical protein